MSTQSKRLEDRLRAELEMARIGIIVLEDDGITDTSAPLDRLRHIAACIAQATELQRKIEARDAREVRRQAAEQRLVEAQAVNAAAEGDDELDPACASDVSVYGAGSV